MADLIPARPLTPQPLDPADPTGTSPRNQPPRHGRHAARRVPAADRQDPRQPEMHSAASSDHGGVAARPCGPETGPPGNAAVRDALGQAMDWLAELRDSHRSEAQAAPAGPAAAASAAPADAGAARGAAASTYKTSRDLSLPQRTPIGDQLRLPIAWCEMGSCISHHADPHALGEADIRARAIKSGWRMDSLGRLACPKCQQTSPWFWTTQPIIVWNRNRADRIAAQMATSVTDAASGAMSAESSRTEGHPASSGPITGSGMEAVRSLPSPQAGDTGTAFPAGRIPRRRSHGGGQRRDLNPVSARAIAPQSAHLMSRAGCQWLTAAAEMAALVSGYRPCPHCAELRWAIFPETGTRTRGMDTRSIREAREFTITAMHRWGTADRCEDMAIVVSELLANALQHTPAGQGSTRTGWQVKLGLLHFGHCLICAVADPGKATPTPREHGHLDETGRGLNVIAALSDQWGYTTPSDSGKVTWALFSTPAVH